MKEPSSPIPAKVAEEKQIKTKNITKEQTDKTSIKYKDENKTLDVKNKLKKAYLNKIGLTYLCV